MTTANGGMRLNFPYRFPHASIVVESRSRVRRMQESWRLLEHEADGAWNYWILITRDGSAGYWLVRKIVPWWGHWQPWWEERSRPASSQWQLN